jgi:hypothetical protein
MQQKPFRAIFASAAAPTALIRLQPPRAEFVTKL